MLHNVIFGLPKNVLGLLPGAQSENGITAQVAVNGLVTLDGTATADTTLTIPASGAALGAEQYTASMSTKSGYATSPIAGSVSSVQTTQSVNNGDFTASSSGLATGFSAYGMTAVSCSKNAQTIVATTQWGKYMYNSLQGGHRYYIVAKVKAASANVCLYANTNQSSTTSAVYHPGDGDFHLMTFIADVEANYTSTIYLQDNSASGWANITIQYMMAVDMGTNASNPLYTLSAAQMAALLPVYFSGTDYVHLAYVSPESPNTFNPYGLPVSSVQLSIPSGAALSQYTMGLQVESGSTATGWVPPGTQGVIFYPATGETGIITNTGNVDAYPVITVTGACANPSVTNETTGETITVNVALGSNDTLVIDCRPATRGCYLNGTLAFGIKQGLGWMHCPPGDNVITFDRNGYDTKRHCTISLQGRYL